MIVARLALVINHIFTRHGLIPEKIDKLPGFLATKVICVSPSLREKREKPGKNRLEWTQNFRHEIIMEGFGTTLRKFIVTY